MITVGSLFSGIGGLELGLERAGMRTVWQVEKDDYCRRVLAKHWPDVQRYDDVCTVGAHNLSPVDLICGGFPCQDISSSGKKVGIQGARSGLWKQYARIIGELRPRYIVVENVADLLARGMGVVLGDLANLGYDAEWEIVSAEDVGAPHLRRRVFIIAYPNADGWGQQVSAQLHGEPLQNPTDGDSRGGHPDRLGHEMAHPAGARRNEGVRGTCRSIWHGTRGAQSERRSGSLGGFSQWCVEPPVGRVADGLSGRVDRLRALGNAVVPQVAEYIGRLIVAADMERAA